MNVCDRELLELAAKAVGYSTNHSWNRSRLELDPPVMGLVVHDLEGELITTGWNPLDHNGDALRLAVDMKIDIFPWISSAEGGATQARNHQGTRTQERSSDNSGCIYSATRRAIVRAAAEIGRAAND